MIHRLVTFIGYKIIWLTGVWGSQYQLAWITPILSVMYAAWCLAHHPSWKRLWLVTLSASAMGILLDSVVFSRYFYAFPTPKPWIPVWLMAIWLAFPYMCLVSLRRLLAYPWLGVIFGAIMGPASYAGASHLGVIIMNAQSSHIIFSMVWGGYMLGLAGAARYVK